LRHGRIIAALAALSMAASPIAASAADAETGRKAARVEGEYFGGEYGLVIAVLALAAIVIGAVVITSGGDHDEAPVSP